MACSCNPFPYSAAVYFENKLQPQYFSPANFLCCSALLPNMHKCSNFFAIDKVAVNNFPILLSDILQTPSKGKLFQFFYKLVFFLKSFCRQKLFFFGKLLEHDNEEIRQQFFLDRTFSRNISIECRNATFVAEMIRNLNPLFIWDGIPKVLQQFPMGHSVSDKKAVEWVNYKYKLLNIFSCLFTLAINSSEFCQLID